MLAKMPSDGTPYALFAFTALLPWTFFNTAVTGGTNSLVAHTQLITKVYFPREILPITYVIAALFDFAIGVVVLSALMRGTTCPLSAQARATSAGHRAARGVDPGGVAGPGRDPGAFPRHRRGAAGPGAGPDVRVAGHLPAEPRPGRVARLVPAESDGRDRVVVPRHPAAAGGAGSVSARRWPVSSPRSRCPPRTCSSSAPRRRWPTSSNAPCAPSSSTASRRSTACGRPASRRHEDFWARAGRDLRRRAAGKRSASSGTTAPARAPS